MEILAQKRKQLLGARVRSHSVFDNLKPIAQYSADILVPPSQQIPDQSGFLRGHLLMICAAKPRYTAAAAREHGRVLAPRLRASGVSVTSPLYTPRKVLFEICQRHVLLTRIKGEERQVQFCTWTTSFVLGPAVINTHTPPSKAAWSHFAVSRTRSFRHADADE